MGRVFIVKIYKTVLEILMKDITCQERKCFGYLISNNSDNIISNYYIFSDDRRQDNRYRGNFENIGNYYIDHSNAGFIASPEEMFWFEQEFIRKRKYKLIAVFHVHLRHPNVFTYADWNLHPSSSLGHLIISLRNKMYPKLQSYVVNKETHDIEEMYKASALDVVNDDESIRKGLNLINYEFKHLRMSLLDKYLFTNYLSKFNNNEYEELVQSCTHIKEKDNDKFNGDGIKRTPVTNTEYKETFSYHNENDSKPVVKVTYYDAYVYAFLNGGRLLTKKEWELYAGNMIIKDPWCHNNSMLLKSAYYSQNSKGFLHEVGQLEPNSFGLYDMFGNVWEWTSSNIATSKNSITKGGSFRAFPEMLNTSFDLVEDKFAFYDDLGFRFRLVV